MQAPGYVKKRTDQAMPSDPCASFQLAEAAIQLCANGVPKLSPVGTPFVFTLLCG